MLLQLKSLGLHKKSITFIEKPVHLHAMLTSCGYERIISSDYDWHGLKRGSSPLVLFQFTISGKGKLMYENTEYDALPNTALILHFPHDNRIWFPKNYKEPWEFIYICLNGSEILRLWNKIEKQKGPLVHLDKNSPTLKLAVNIYKKAVKEEIQTPFDSSILAYKFALTLSKELLDIKHVKTQPMCVSNAIKFCKENYFNIINMDDIAHSSGFSRFHFSRVFFESQSISPWSYLINIRVEEASKLLRDTKHTIKEIARKCGFTDTNYFCKVFLKKTGNTPASFRKSGLL